MARRRPAPITVGPIRCRAIRGPTRASALWYWRAELYRDGASRTVWTGRGERGDVEAALAALVASGEHLEPTQRHASQVRTVADLARAWLWAQEEQRQDLAASTRGSYRGCVTRLVPLLEDTMIDRADVRLGERVRDRSLRLGRSTGTVAHDLQVLGTIWAWASALGVVRGDLPLPRVRVRPARPRHTPDDGEVADVLAWLRARHRWAWITAWLLSITGCRLGEVAALRAGDVDRHRCRLLVDGKTGRRIVPLLDDDLEVLVELLEGLDAGDLVHGVAASTVRTYLTVRIAQACAELGRPRWTPHALRRAAVDRLYRSGVDVAAAAALLGQSPQVALRSYRQVSESDVEAAVRRAQLGPRPAALTLRAVGDDDPHT